MDYQLNPDWNYIITFLGLFLSILPLILSIKLSFTKALDLASQNCQTVIQPIDENNKVKKLHRIELILLNYGKDVIYKADLYDRLRVNINKITSFESIRIFSTCEFIKVDHNITNSGFEFSFDFLEPDKYIKIELNYFSFDDVEAFFVGKVIGGSKFYCQLNKNQTWENNYWLGRKEIRAGEAFLVTFLGLSLLTYATIPRMFNLRFNDLISIASKFNKESLLFYFIIIILLLVFFFISKRIYNLYLPFALLAKKEKTWHEKTNYSL